MTSLRTRRFMVSVLILIIAVIFGINQIEPEAESDINQPAMSDNEDDNRPLAINVLDELDVKGRAAKTGYAREQFGSGWRTVSGCDTRNNILIRDLKEVELSESCQVMKGMLNDPYTGKEIEFKRGTNTSREVQIDHVVALSNAWQTGAQQLDYSVRIEFANDPLNLLAVDGPSNQQKGDSDAASWLPSNKPFRCQYVARQVAIKKRYKLWVTPSEKSAIQSVLNKCPEQRVMVYE